MENRERKYLITQIIIIVMLVGCFLPMAHWYYNTVRWVLALGFYCLFKWHRDEIEENNARPNNVILLFSGFMIIVFNPLYPLHFEKKVWHIIDVIVISALLFWLAMDYLVYRKFK